MKENSLKILSIRYLMAMLGIVPLTMSLYFLTSFYNKATLANDTEMYIFLPWIMLALFLPPLFVQAFNSIQLKILLIWGAVASIIIFLISTGIYYMAICQNILLLNNQTPIAVLFGTIGIILFIGQTIALSSNSIISDNLTYRLVACKLSFQIVFTCLFIICIIIPGLILTIYTNHLILSVMVVYFPFLLWPLGFHISDNEKIVKKLCKNIYISYMLISIAFIFIIISSLYLSSVLGPLFYFC